MRTTRPGCKRIPQRWSYEGIAAAPPRWWWPMCKSRSTASLYFPPPPSGLSMKNSKDQYHCAGLLAAVIVFALLPQPAPSQTASSKEAIDTIWTVPNVGALPDDSDGRLVRRGRDLVTATYSYIGPEVSNRSKRYAGNNLACGNCHLEAGTKRF